MAVRHPAASRRTLVTGAVATTAVAGLAAPASATAYAGRRFSPARYRGAPLLGARDRHLVGRFAYAVTPDLARRVHRAGGARAWFEAQLDAASVADAGVADLDAWWPSLGRGPADLWTRNVDGVEGGWEVMIDYQRWVLMRRMRSHRQLLETMTELWENHFNVPVNGDAQFTWRKRYGDVIREHALGSFDDLLQAVVTHPALLISLDNVSSTAEHPNENLGRELLELHTVGLAAYDEDDVKDSARILTGWTVDMWDTFAAVYDPSAHSRGRVNVLGFSHPNRSADGHAVTRAYLSYLAHHPATARQIARKLAVKFVRDNPPQDLVDELARVYLAHDTQIRPVLRALVGSRAFRESVGAKVRDPGEDLVASFLALDARLHRPPDTAAGDGYAANAMIWQASQIGTKPFDWPRPDGQPIDNRSWASPSRLLASMDVHLSLSGGWWPSHGVTYHSPASWLPESSIRFDRLVDHLAQRLLHQNSTGALLEACCLAVGVSAHDTITRDHAVVRWQMPQLLTTFLDSPAFLTR